MNRIYLSLLALLFASTISGHALSADSRALANAVVTAPDRSPEDRALDAGRKPAEFLIFLGVQTGWRIADLGAGGGYTAELLKRAVGSEGVVYGQNSPAVLQRFAEKSWSARVAKPVMKGVVRLDRDFEDPFPADLAPLDAVTFVLFYHDTVWLGVNRDAMNKAVFAALKPGGVLFSSNPHGDNQEGWNRGRYGAYHDLESWRRYLAAAGFAEIGLDTLDRDGHPTVGAMRFSDETKPMPTHRLFTFLR
jgi:predicted methyltransferase